VIERLATQGGNELIGSTPAQFAQLIRSEIAKYGKVIRDAGIRIELAKPRNGSAAIAARTVVLEDAHPHPGGLLS